jgi:histidyl-tRNA synthetase
MAGPDIDAELICLTARFWKRLGLQDITLQINSLGSNTARTLYRERLVDYFRAHSGALDEDSRRRLDSNPLRILDTKSPQMREIVAEAPSLLDYLDEESLTHFLRLRDLLEAAGLPYEVNPRLVRGLDYYCKTVFEWVSERVGTQGTVCAGGRYDGLTEQLGGRSVAGAGFAVGMERLIALLTESGYRGLDPAPHVYLVLVGEAAERQGIVLAERLRDRLPRLRLQVNCGGGSFKAQFKRADRSRAKLALILAEDEVSAGRITVKPLREESGQISLVQDELIGFLQTSLASAL